MQLVEENLRASLRFFVMQGFGAPISCDGLNFRHLFHIFPHQDDAPHLSRFARHLFRTVNDRLLKLTASHLP